MVKITGIETRDMRFQLAKGEGTDAVHSAGLYGFAVTVLRTDDAREGGLTGDGLSFTLGAGTDLVCQAIQHLAKPLVGREIEELMAGFGKTFKELADHPALRWLGPHNGVVHLALSSITNACWDLWAKKRGKPLWELLLSLGPEELLATLDLSYLEDALTAEEALAMLRTHKATRKEREGVLKSGVPGYDTSAGWLDFSDEEIREKVKRSLEAGFKAVKLKVGGFRPEDMERDLRRMKLIRSVVGPDFRIALDANQQWTLPQALEICPRLCEMNPFWIEEPTHPADVAAHARLAKAVSPVPIAVGEAIPNRIVFKNFITQGAVQVVQADPSRLGGVSECLLVAMLAKKHGLRVIPHVGDMGQISQHLVIAYHVLLDIPLVFLEYIPHLRDYFVHPAVVENGVYVPPVAPGCSTTLRPKCDVVKSDTLMFEDRTWLGDGPGCEGEDEQPAKRQRL